MTGMYCCTWKTVRRGKKNSVTDVLFMSQSGRYICFTKNVLSTDIYNAKKKDEPSIIMYETAPAYYHTAVYNRCIYSVYKPAGKNETVNGNLQQQCVHRLTDVIVYDIFTPRWPAGFMLTATSHITKHCGWKRQRQHSPLLNSWGAFDAMPVLHREKLWPYPAAVHAFLTLQGRLHFQKRQSYPNRRWIACCFQTKHARGCIREFPAAGRANCCCDFEKSRIRSL